LASLARSRNIAKRAAAPRCAATMYSQPARRASALWWSKATKKKAATAMASQATRKRMPLRASTTSAMLKARRL